MGYICEMKSTELIALSKMENIIDSVGVILTEKKQKKSLNMYLIKQAF